MHHPASTTGMLGANATTTIPSEPPTKPITIQGRRMPRCEDVRSLILPKNGLATIAKKEPTPVTSPKLFGARSMPTSELIIKAKVTSTGARNIRVVPIYASVYSEMKPQPTRFTPGDPAVRPSRLRFGNSNPFNPHVDILPNRKERHEIPTRRNATLPGPRYGIQDPWGALSQPRDWLLPAG
jgi:hypothetical protein